MAGTVRVTGLRETRRAYERGSDELRELDKALQRIAEPVARDVRGRLAPYGNRTVTGVKVRRRGFEVKVQQTRRKTTGKRPDFGALQMHEAFIPVLLDNESRVLQDVERWLDKAFRKVDL